MDKPDTVNPDTDANGIFHWMDMCPFSSSPVIVKVLVKVGLMADDDAASRVPNVHRATFDASSYTTEPSVTRKLEVRVLGGNGMVTETSSI